MTNQPTSNNLYAVANGVSSSSPFIEVFQPIDPTSNDVNYPVQKRWFNTATNNEWVLIGFTSSSGVVSANWQNITTGGGSQINTLTGNSGGAVAPSGNNINVVGDGTSINVSGNPGTHTLTISAVSGGVIVENFNVQTGTSPVVPSSGSVTINGATVAAGTHPVRTDGTGASTLAIEVQTSQAIASTDATKIGLSAFNSNHFSVDANGFVSATGFSTTDYHDSRYIVSAGGAADGANYTTIASAYAAAVAAGAPQTVFIQPGVYTENISLTSEINICAHECDAYTPNVTIVGKLTFSGAGSVSISGIRLKTNSDNFLVVSGSSASIVNLENCFLDCSNNTGISFTSSSGAAKIYCAYCKGDLQTTGIALFDSSSSGSIYFNYCEITNSGGSSTGSTISAGGLNLNYDLLYFPITSSSTSSIGIEYCYMDTSTQNAICVTHGGSGGSTCYASTFLSGNASSVSISVGATLTMSLCSTHSNNANSITGAGTLNYGTLSFVGPPSINTTTQNLKVGTAFQKVVVQTFTSNGTYTPTSGMKYCTIQLVGGGGGGGGVVASGANTCSIGGGGGAGGYSYGVFSTFDIGASQAVTVGAAGAAGANTGGTGGTGGTTSVGALISATGGTGGTGNASATVFQNTNGGAGGTGSSGSVNTKGQGGGAGIGANVAGTFSISQSGFGGASFFGGGGISASTSSGGSNGDSSASYGAGGAGGVDVADSTARTGGAGSAGVVVITEYI